MPTKDDATHIKQERHSRITGAALIILNALFLLVAFYMYTLYNSAYRESLREENLGNIENLNHSAAENTTALFESWSTKLADITQYVELHDLDIFETMDVINDSNSNPDRYFELIGSDYSGYLISRNADGSYPALDYSHHSYESLQKVFDRSSAKTSDGIYFAPEFTDAGETGLKFFAVCEYLTLRNEQGEPENFTLMLAAPSKTVLEVLTIQQDYVGQSTVLINEAGDYILSNKEYKASNFFQYLYSYNDLTLDQRNEIEREFLANERGELYYKNAGVVVEDCVYRYEKMTRYGWYCVTSVPLSSFTEPNFNNAYLFYAVAFLVLMFVIDIIWFQSMNRRLRISAENERIANYAKSSFLSRMSHEIRTPLNAVIGYNTIAKNELNIDDADIKHSPSEIKVADCLQKSDIASKHLLSVINDVLDMSAIESGKIKLAKERFDFRGLITSLTTVFYSQAKAKGVEFDVIFHSLTEEWFIGDQMRVNQILTNLLSNAVKFTPDGGTVTLRITQPDAESDASHIHFEVEDTGIGMTAEYIGHIFTPFEQADSSISRRFGGSGLGLSITKSLVDLMGGTIKVESTHGVGTKFQVDLTFGRTEQPEKSSHYDFSSINALVADDDASTCDYIRLLFTRCGAKCVTVTSGEDAVKAVSDAIERGKSYSLCLVDWRMPKMDGIDTIQKIREISSDAMPIVVLTAYDYSEIADKAVKIGVDKFISKPLFQSSLFDLLATICGDSEAKVTKKDKAFDFAGAHILLAEDNMMNMEIAKTIMQSAGLEVDSAWNGREAVELFTASKPGYYKAILMDVHMPEMNGHDATRAIRASGREDAATIPIIAMTADAFAENVAEAHESGMNAHISKPIDTATLFNTLKRFV